MLLIECLCVSRVGFIYLVHVYIRIDYVKYIYLNINSVSIRNYADVYIYGVYVTWQSVYVTKKTYVSWESIYIIRILFQNILLCLSLVVA